MIFISALGFLQTIDSHSMIVDRKVNQLVIFVLGSAQPLLDWDRRARIQFGQVYFGVFSTSRFVVGPK